jgi:2-polyprenyl-6-methoxyphenol hydroxylase-like FAD-dependent oxidoreductase
MSVTTTSAAPLQPDVVTECDVAIVGYGPVGRVLAILLGQLGHRVVVLERQSSPYVLPRAVTFDSEIARILQMCGIGDRIPELTESAGTYEWRAADGRVLLRFGGGGDTHMGWPAASMFHQPELEAALDARARSFDSVGVHWGAQVSTVDDLGTHVDLAVQQHDATSVVRAQFVVGCDGANSSVRTALDLPVVDLGFFFDWLIVDVVLNEPRVWDPSNLQICDPARPTTVVSGGPGRRRWEFMLLPGEEAADLNSNDVAWTKLAPWNVTPDNARIDRHTVYTFQARWVDEWRRGRVMVAGDAAHQMPPFAGQGMCSGIRDAANLSWKLDAVLRGLAQPDVFDTYQQERQAHVKAIVEFSMALGQVICVLDPAEAAARDDAMSAMVTPDTRNEVPPLPGITDGIIDAGSPLAGTLAPQFWVDQNGAQVRFDDVYGAGWRLIVSTDGDSAPDAGLDPSVASWFRSLGGRIVHAPEESAAGAWFSSNNCTALLQRPDFVLFGTGNDPAALVTSLATSLS